MSFQWKEEYVNYRSVFFRLVMCKRTVIITDFSVRQKMGIRRTDKMYNNETRFLPLNSIYLSYV